MNDQDRRANAPPFLPSFDLEDIGSLMPGTTRYRGRVPALVDQFLEFLDRRGLGCTFFSTGDVARRHPEVIKLVASAGHEIASHGSDHVTLDQMTRASFKVDLERSRDLLMAAGAEEVVGFRAPMASLTNETSWAYDVLAESGFIYSSSVAPCWSPFYGWPGFPLDCSQAASGIWEIPLSVGGFGPARMPFSGGMYLRVLPRGLVRWFLRAQRRRDHVVSYIHPYDFDTQQEKFFNPEIQHNPVYRWMMYRNRASALDRLDELISASGPVLRYVDFVRTALVSSVERDERGRA